MFLYRLAPALEIEPLSQATLPASRPKEGEAARFVLGARGGHIAHATECNIGLALVEDSPEKSTEGHHDAFACVEPDCRIIL